MAEAAKRPQTKVLLLLEEAVSRRLCSTLTMRELQTQPQCFAQEVVAWRSRWSRASAYTRFRPGSYSPPTLQIDHHNYLERLHDAAKRVQVHFQELVTSMLQEDGAADMNMAESLALLQAILEFQFEMSLAIVNSSPTIRDRITCAGSSLLDTFHQLFERIRSSFVAVANEPLRCSPMVLKECSEQAQMVCEAFVGMEFDVMVLAVEAARTCCEQIARASLDLDRAIRHADQENRNANGTSESALKYCFPGLTTLDSLGQFLDVNSTIVGRLLEFLETRFELVPDDGNHKLCCMWLDAVMMLCGRLALHLTRLVAVKGKDSLRLHLSDAWIHGKALCDLLGAQEQFFEVTEMSASGMTLAGRQLAYLSVRSLKSVRQALLDSLSIDSHHY